MSAIAVVILIHRRLKSLMESILRICRRILRCMREFKRTLTAARRAAGLPVTRRLPSLFHKLSGTSPVPETTSVAEPRASVQERRRKKHFVRPSRSSTMRFGIMCVLQLRQWPKKRRGRWRVIRRR